MKRDFAKQAPELLTGLRKGSRICLLSMWQKLAGVEQFTTTQFTVKQLVDLKVSAELLRRRTTRNQEEKLLLQSKLDLIGRVNTDKLMMCV